MFAVYYRKTKYYSFLFLMVTFTHAFVKRHLVEDHLKDYVDLFLCTRIFVCVLSVTYFVCTCRSSGRCLAFPVVQRKYESYVYLLLLSREHNDLYWSDDAPYWSDNNVQLVIVY